MIGYILFKVEPISASVFAEEFVCVCVLGHTTLQQVFYNLSNPLISSCTEAQIQLEVKEQGLLRCFLDICKAMHMCINFQSPRNILELFKALYFLLILQFCLLYFLIRILLFPTYNATIRSGNVEQLLLIFFFVLTNALWIT